MEQAIAPRSLQQRDVLAWFLGLGAAAGATSLALFSPHFAVSVGVGALLQLSNFRALWTSCEKILLVGGSGAGLAVATFSVRFVFLGVAVGIALWAGIDPTGLLLGLSLIIPAAVVAAWRVRPPVLANAHVLPEDDPTWDLWNPWLAREQEPVDEDEPVNIFEVGADVAPHRVADEEKDA